MVTLVKDGLHIKYIPSFDTTQLSVSTNTYPQTLHSPGLALQVLEQVSLNVFRVRFVDRLTLGFGTLSDDVGNRFLVASEALHRLPRSDT